MATTIKLKNSVTTTNVPSSLAQGEVAINVTDKKVWVGNASSTPVQLLGTGSDGTFTNLTVSGTTALNGGATLGDASGDALTINSSAVSIPNGLNFDSNTFVIDATNNAVGIGTNSIVGKLHVYGDTNGNITERIENANSGSSAYANLQLRNDATNTCELGIQSSTRSTTYPVNEGWLYTSVGLNLGYAGATKFYSGSAERMRLDSSGNLGLGVTPSSWGSSFRAIQLYGGALMSNASAAGLYMPTNAYYNGTNYIYSTTAAASNYTQTAGEHKWFYAASGTAGNAITFTQAMTLNASGNLGIGTSSPSGRLSVTTSTMTNQIIADSMSDSTTYGLVSLNASRVSTGYLGIAGGGGTDKTLFYNVPSTGKHSFRNNFSEQMVLDSSGNLGIGVTPSVGNFVLLQTQRTAITGGANDRSEIAYNYYRTSGVDTYIGTDYASRYRQINGQHIWYYAPSGTAGTAATFTQAMTLDASGNLGIGTTSPSSRLHVVGSGNTLATIGGSTGQAGISLVSGGAYSPYMNWYSSGTTLEASIFAVAGSGAFAIGTGASGTERMRIDSSGNCLIGTTDAGISTGVGTKLLSSSTIPSINIVGNTSSSGVTPFTYYNTNATLNGYRFYVKNDGGIANYSANNVNLSDIRTKTDIELADSYLDKICSIPVKTFKYKDQTDNELNLGVIAQDVEAVAPELVDVSGFGDTPEDGVPLKAIYQTDLVYALMKSIQELKAEVDSLKAQLNK
jgi:hypothetical protein